MAAVGWYLRFGVSYRDVEELLLERGIDVDPRDRLPVGAAVTPLLADAGRCTRRSAGGRWFVDETHSSNGSGDLSAGQPDIRLDFAPSG